MAIADRTWEQIRTSIGYNLGAFFSSTTTGTVDASSVIDSTLQGGDDEHNGKWVIATSGTNDGAVRKATDYTASSTDITTEAFSATVPSGMTYELWGERYDPTALLDFANQAQLMVYGKAYDPTESIALHGDSVTARFDIPSGFSQLSRVDYRSGVSSLIVHDMNSQFDETPDSDFTQTVDDQDSKLGSSLKLTVADGGSEGDFVTDSIGSIDISKYTHLEGWVKSTVALSAGDYKIHLDNGTVTADGNDQESLSVPAVSSTLTWTYFRIALANPENDTAIISVGIEMDQDKGAHTVWFDNLRVVVNDSATWSTLGRRSWRIDKEARDLVLTPDALSTIGDSLIKLVGGGEPALLTTDSSVAEIHAQYVIAMATALALDSQGGGPSTDPDSLARRGALWYARAEQAKRAFPFLVNVRRIE